ncbi:MAG: Tad domain-containing protein [Dehalococcoidia bacterium]
MRQKTIRRNSENGQILVLFALLLSALIGMVAMVVDVGFFLRERQNLQNVVDASALAAAQELPDDDLLADDVALNYAQANDSDLTLENLDITFRCIVGNLNGSPNPTHIPASCDPGGNASWTCSGSRCYSMCVPNEGDKCNTIVVGAETNVPFIFAPVVGVFNTDTGGIKAAACSGSCGGPLTAPLDVAMIIDRSGSMSDSTNCGLPGSEIELDCAKDAAKDVLEIFNPAYQHVALGLLGPSNMGSTCSGSDSPGKGVPSGSGSSGSWLPVGFQSDYQSAFGVLDTSSLIVKTINCTTTSSVGTNLGSPISDGEFGLPDAVDELTTNGRADVKKAILFFTDGAANEPSNGASSDTGYLNCGANASQTGGDGNGFEGSPGNACADDSSNATDTNSGTGTSTSCTNSGKDKHRFYDYGISIPVDHGVDGIEVRLDARADSSSGTSRLCVQLSWDGGSSWTSSDQTNQLTSSFSTYTLGSSSDDWGHTWTNAQTSDANFRVRVISVSDSTSRDFTLDWVAVRVTHSEDTNPCEYAVEMAQIAKDADIEVFTLGYGLENEDCVDDGSSSPYQNASVTEVLAAMATDSIDETGCDTAAEADQENLDGDHFLCEVDAAGLAAIFQQAAEVLAAGTRLVMIPDF